MKLVTVRAVSLSALFLASTCAAAAQPGRLNATVKSPCGALKDHPFVRQYKVLINSSGDAITILNDLPPGTYEREEVAARLAKLDAEVADLKKTSAGK
jgi:hypothetical protein